MKKNLISVVLSFSLATLAPAQNKLAPATTAASVRYLDATFSVTRTNDLTYGQAVNASTGNMQTLKLDLYQPTGDTAPSRAAIIWIHAGGFVQGEKGNSETSTRCEEFTKRGYVAASIDYRLWESGNPGSSAVQQAYEDAKAAVRWLRANAATYRIDVNRISIAGTSSGAITAVHATYEEAEGNSGNPGYASEVSACIDGSGFLEFDDHIEIGEAPLLIVHGDQDTDVPYSEALKLEARALATGIPYEFHTLVGQDHFWTSEEKAQFIDWAIDFNFRYVAQTGPTGVPVATVGDVTVSEGNAGTVNVVFTVTLSASTANGQVVTMDYSTANGSATAGSDYVTKSGTISIAAGATTQTVAIAVNGDTNSEPNENFFLNLQKPANARINDLQGVGTIQDDDLAGAPAAPTNLVATPVSTSQVNLNWSDNSNNEDGFRLERKTASTSFVEIAMTAAQAQSYSDLTASAATAYSYRVRAYNNLANSGYSNEAGATTPCDVNATFTANTTSGCAPLNVAFTDQSTGNPISWLWNFGEGGTSTAQNPAYVFNAPGTYTITLTVASALCNDVETKTSYITVTGPPTANFTGSPTSGNSPLTVNFTNQSTGGATSWLWDFGNGASSTLQNPSQQYTAAGTYTVTLTATNACGSDPEVKTNYITVTNTPVNVALNKPATASSTNGSDTPSKAVDGSTSTYWRSGSISSSTITWLRVDLQTASNVNRVVIKWNGSYYAKNYQIQVSNDNTNWSTVYTDNAGNGGTDDYTFAATTGRYVRVYMTKNNKSSERVNELEVYGAAGMVAKFVDDVVSLAATPVELLQNYPNPFNPQTKIRFSLAAQTHVTLRVLNALGQEVALLLDEPRPVGTYEITFDAHAQPSGVYFAVLQTGAERRVQRLLLMK